MSDGTMFAGDHSPDGVFASLKGPMLAPHLQMPMESNAMGDSRHIDEAATLAWDASVIVTTGCTGPGGQLANK